MARISEILTLDVRSVCDNPVYLRWKTTVNGWGYYMFDLKQLKAVSVDSIEMFRENFTALAAQTIVNNFYKKNSRDVWELFGENIETNDIEVLQTLADSPRVERYTGDLTTHSWESVIITGFVLVNDTFKNRHNVSISIDLPENFTLSN